MTRHTTLHTPLGMGAVSETESVTRSASTIGFGVLMTAAGCPSAPHVSVTVLVGPSGLANVRTSVVGETSTVVFGAGVAGLQAVATAKDRLAANQAARRDIEKDLAVQQGRLSKYREQSDKVKTNQEYHAIQHEMAFAQNEIRGHEDRMLERMMESDDISTALAPAIT